MKKKLFIILPILIIIGIGGFLGYKNFIAAENPADSKKIDYEKAIENQILIETITTNLNKDNHFIIAGFTVQTDSEEATKEFNARLSEMKSLAIQNFNNLSKSEIVGDEGSQKIINGLKDSYNKKLTKGKVTDVYLTEFKVQ